MKILENKGIIFKLIVSLCVFLALINFLGSIDVYAAEESQSASTGGKLLQPILDLIMSFGDGLINLVQYAIMGTPATNIIDISTAVWQVVAGVLALVAGILVIVAAAILAPGIVAAVGPIVAGIVKAGIITATVVGALVAGSATYMAAYSFGKATFLPDYTTIPTIAISPESIFSGDLMIFDVNFFNPKEIMVALSPKEGDTENITERMASKQWDETVANGGGGDLQVSYYYYVDTQGNEVKTSKQSASATLNQLVSKWYYSIRNVAIVVLMAILVYVGIRMLLTSIASEKSKYKKMLGDWIVAMCLIFVLHYIMIFAVNLNENIVSIMKSVNEKQFYVHAIEISDDNKSKNLVKSLKDAGFTDWFYTIDGVQTDADNAKLVIIPTNLMGQTRLRAQELNGITEYIGYAIAYIVLVFYTVFFAFTYLKRVLMMAFLTVIAPFVAMTYPLDKISDGHAQAFNKWLKEYIFNLLIQPVHLLLYVLLISMAFDLAGQNILYSLVAIGFMIPAEKFVRSLFGFDKASTPGFLEGAAGAALVMSGMQTISNFGKRHLPPGGNPKGQNDSKPNNNEDPNNLYNRSANSGNNFGSLLGGGEDDGYTASDNAGGGPTLVNPPGQDNNDNNDGDIGDSLVNPPSQENSPMDESLQDDPLNRTLDEDAQDIVNVDYTNLAEDALAEGQNLFDFGNEDDYEDTIDYADFETTGEDEAYVMPSPEESQENIGRKINTSKAIVGPQQKPEDARKARLEELKNDKSNKGWRKRMIGQDIRKRAKDPKTYTGAIATALRGASKIAGATTGAIIGGAAGIASGDIGKVAQNAAIGGTSGYALSGAAANLVANPIENYPDARRKHKQAMEQAKYGSSYSEIKKLESDERFKKDADARKFYANEFSGQLNGLKGKEREEKLDQIMEDAIKYREYGITDNEKIVKAMNLDKMGNRTSQKSIASALMASKATDLKSIESYQKKLEAQVGEKQAREIAEGAMQINGLGFSKQASTNQHQNNKESKDTKTQQQQPKPKTNTNTNAGPRFKNVSNNPPSNTSPNQPTPTNPDVSQT